MNGLAHRHTDRQLLTSYIMSSATELKKNRRSLKQRSIRSDVSKPVHCITHSVFSTRPQSLMTTSDSDDGPATLPPPVTCLITTRPLRLYVLFDRSARSTPDASIIQDHSRADWRCSRMLEKSTNKKLAWLNWTYYSLHLKSSSQNRSRWRQPEETAVPLSSLKGTWWWRWRWWRQENNSVLYRVSLWLLADCIFYFLCLRLTATVRTVLEAFCFRTVSACVRPCVITY